jgi:hypothetical protein
MGHWRQNHETESNLLRSSDLYDSANSKPGRDAYYSPVVLIEKMSKDRIKSREKPRGEMRNFAHFKGKSKPLGLNVTNCETLTSLSGSSDPQHWVGLSVQLYVDPQAKYPSGKKGPAIRIRPMRPTGQADTSPLPSVPDADRERLESEHEERLSEPGEGG